MSSLDRVGKALTTQSVVNQQFRWYVIKDDTLLHRAELLLEDHPEWEFNHSCLTDMEYAFLHLYCSAVIQIFSHVKKERVSFNTLIRVFQSAIVTMQSVERNDQADEKYDPSKDKVSFLPRKELTDVERMCYDLVPMLLLYIQVSPQYESQCQSEWWRVSLLEKSLEFMSYSHSLLLKRGLGDGE